MREKKYTQGPWRVGDRGEKEYVFVQRGKSGGFCIQHQNGHESAVADAHLIAAAPELLEALEESLRFINDALSGNDTRSQAKQVDGLINYAIAKAYGETP